MKKTATLLAAATVLLETASAHSGLYHSYSGEAVGVLMVMLWATLAVYEELGDTFRGHWALFGGIFLSFYVPIAYPHDVIDTAGVGVGLAGVLLIGVLTFIWHRSTDRDGA